MPHTGPNMENSNHSTFKNTVHIGLKVRGPTSQSIKEPDTSSTLRNPFGTLLAEADHIEGPSPAGRTQWARKNVCEKRVPCVRMMGVAHGEATGRLEVSPCPPHTTQRRDLAWSSWTHARLQTGRNATTNPRTTQESQTTAWQKPISRWTPPAAQNPQPAEQSAVPLARRMAWQYGDHQ